MKLELFTKKKADKDKVVTLKLIKSEKDIRLIAVDRRGDKIPSGNILERDDIILVVLLHL